ncbi:methylation-associated defense system ATP-binding protein MAD8 [Nocardia nova]|uniref:methylation-associated defense system ATP-binding protein MAD8 n=1 Tax=Nocardia nova TaxID=37330 RepID=UPI0007C6DB32|nr:ATP-binding protein [Nocardia nova]
MSEGMREIRDRDVDEALEDVLAPRLARVLLSRSAGHCCRISGIAAGPAGRLCLRVRSACGDRAQAWVLGSSPGMPEDVTVSSTKLIELRNPDEGRLRAPLLVFVPPGTKASAEDSFDIATFEEIHLGDVYRVLELRLLEGISGELRHGVDELLSLLAEHEWPFADSYARARYLLAVTLNDSDRDVAGAAVFELGLIPDFELFRDVSAIRARASRNIQQMSRLVTSDRPARQRVLELGLTEPGFRNRFAEFLARQGTENPMAWTRRIVVDRDNWSLAFHRWPLRDERPRDDRVTVRVRGVDLPMVGSSPDHAHHPVLSTIVGQRFLVGGSEGANQLSAEFDVDPDPRDIAGLEKFVVQLVSETSGPTGVSASVRVSKTVRRVYTPRLKKLRAAELEDGWHYVRVLPVDHDGVPFPLSPDRDGDRSLNESDRFFVLTDQNIEDQSPRPKITKAPGVTHAVRARRFQALTERSSRPQPTLADVAWKDGYAAVHASLGSNFPIEIPLAPVLAELERSILSAPQQPGRWWLPIRTDVAGPASAIAHQHRSFDGEAGRRFVAARTELFMVVRGDTDMVVEGRDVGAMRDLVVEYAEAYRELLDWLLFQAERDDATAPARLAELNELLQIDSVSVDYRDSFGGRTELTLIAPTHPLRMLWLTTWATLGDQWITDCGSVDTNITQSTATAHAALSPVGFPFAVPREGGRIAVAHGELTPYWGVYFPTNVSDPQALLSTISTALGLPLRRTTEEQVSGGALADRVERYLRLHPYVGTVVINAVNAGAAEPLADMLLQLQHRAALREMNYELRLFTARAESPVEGSALAALLRGEWRDTADAEAYREQRTVGSTPKLLVAVRPVSEFRSATTEYSAHLTFLFDAFSNEEFSATVAGVPGMSPVHGLVQDIGITYSEDENVATWLKRPQHGTAHRLSGAEELTDLLSTLPETISHSTCAVATGQAGTRMVPTVTLSLDIADNTLLHQAHQTSDWVITIDRTLGIEYFDNPYSRRRSDYIIDFEGDLSDGLGHHMVISSRSMDELCALLEPVAAQHDLSVDPRHTRAFFDQLRLLSGRLAFKIASTAATQRTEVLGLALARLYLDYQGVLANQILVPLDSHLELYREARATDDIGESVGLQRTDLALFSLDARRWRITCRLVEVKCYSTVTVATYDELKTKIAGQLERSTEIIAQHFDPHLTQPDRPGRAVRNATLAHLLRFYLDRAVRHDVIGARPAAEARWMLDRLDREPAYRLEFTRTGLIFDLSGADVSTEMDGSVEYHLVGRDIAKELIDAIPTVPAGPVDAGTEPSLSTLRKLDLTVPRFAEAQFREPARDHDITDMPSPDPQTDPASTIDSGHDDLPQDAPREATEAVSLETADYGEPAGNPPPDRPADTEVGEYSKNEPPNIVLGSMKPSPQYGVLGEVAGKTIALDLNETHTISLFGIQGGGKSYTLGTIIEAASLPHAPINQLPHPLATIVFHYSPTLDYAPEFTSMIRPNDDVDQATLLRTRYGVDPAALPDVVMLVPHDQLDVRRAEYPDLQVLPLKFGSGELRAEHWRFLMGAIGNQSTYIRQLQRIMKANRRNLRLDVIRDGIEESSLSDNLKQLAQQRLDLAAEYIDDTAQVKTLIRPGRVIIVDLRDEFIEKDEALGLFVVLMQLFAEAQANEQRCNKLVVFDEAHKYIDSPDLVAGLVESVREMRHKGMSVLVASQDPPSVPISLIELSNHVILHKFTSPAWLKHLQKANASLSDLTPAKMANLTQGEAYIWSSKATDNSITKSAVKVRLRPRMTRHGGGTKTAVDNR